MVETPLLVLDDLHASVDGTEILKGVTLTINPGETHAIMGPNGSGKSTLAYVLLGHPAYVVTKGTITYKGEDITKAKPEVRGKSGMFLGFQYPQEIAGVSVVNFLRTALSNRTGIEYTVLELRLKVMEAMRDLGMEDSFADRYLNEGFSGGDRTRNEIIQMRGPERAMVIITHYQRMLNYITPDFVHVFVDGRIVESGQAALADRIEERGYDDYRTRVSSG